MKAYLSHKIEILPTSVQRTFMAKSCGTSRVGYNTGLAIWESEYLKGNKPTMFTVKKLLNARKKQDFPWSYEVSKCCMEEAIIDLGRAYSNFFKVESARRPRFKKKGKNDSFRMGKSSFKLLGNRLRIAKLDKPIKLAEEFRFTGNLISCTISKKADKWFASVNVELDWEYNNSNVQKQSTVGVDVGIKSLAVLSDGKDFVGPKPHKELLRKLRRANKSLARKVKGSNNWRKAKTELGRVHLRISNIRKDYLHKLTTFLAKNYSKIVIEDLNVKSMVRNRKLSRSLMDSSFGMFRTMLEYKCKLYNSTLVLADRFFPSTKMCSSCGKLKDMKLSDRTYSCSCGLSIDRDLNASINLAKYTAVGSTA